MKIGILYNKTNNYDVFTDRFKKILVFNNINVKILDINSESFWQDILEVQYFITRWVQWDDHLQIANKILPVLENEYKLKCFPNTATFWPYNDKIKQFYLLKSKGFPIINSHIFYEKNAALQWSERTNYPTVFKLSSGAGSESVVLIKNQNLCTKIIKSMFGSGFHPRNISFADALNKTLRQNIKTWIKKHILRNYLEPHWQIEKNYVLFQDFMPNNEFDTRITIIGKRAYSYRRFNRKNDFRSSGSGLIDFNEKEINTDFIRIAFDVTKKFNFQSMAFDFLYDKDGNPCFCEISYTFVDEYLYKCPGYWDHNLNWHRGHYWPQLFILQDLMSDFSLKQPENLL